MLSSNEILAATCLTLVATYASIFTAYQVWSFRVREFFDNIRSFLRDASHVLRHIDSYVERRAVERERMLELLRQRNIQYARPAHAPGSWQESVEKGIKAWASVEDRKGSINYFLTGVASVIFSAMLKEHGKESCLIHFRCQYSSFIREFNEKYWGRLSYSYAGKTHVVTGYVNGVEAKTELWVNLGNDPCIVPKNLPVIQESTSEGKAIRKKIEGYLASPVPVQSLKVPAEIESAAWPYKGTTVDYTTASIYRYLYDDIVKACDKIRPANSFEYLIAVRFMLEETPHYSKLKAGLCKEPFASILVWGLCKDRQVWLKVSVGDGDRALSVLVVNDEARDLIESDGATVQ